MKIEIEKEIDIAELADKINEGIAVAVDCGHSSVTIDIPEAMDLLDILTYVADKAIATFTPKEAEHGRK